METVLKTIKTLTYLDSFFQLLEFERRTCLAPFEDGLGHRREPFWSTATIHFKLVKIPTWIGDLEIERRKSLFAELRIRIKLFNISNVNYTVSEFVNAYWTERVDEWIDADKHFHSPVYISHFGLYGSSTKNNDERYER